jgi:peptidoglycan/xylan/chitin deacetylase (PgdA/CDA1 family)
MPDTHRIVVFTSSLAHSVCKGIVEIDRAIEGLSWLVLLHAPRKSARQLLRNQWLNLKRNGWRWIPYQAADLWQRARRARHAAPGSSAPGADFESQALGQRQNLRLLKNCDLHSTEAREAVRAFTPDLGLSIAAPILRPALFALPRHGTINLHKGRLPDYRGMPPAFWELMNGEKSVGCTVHEVDAGLDTGRIIRTAVVDRAPYATLRGMQLQLDEVGVALMRDAALDLLAGTAEPRPQPGGGKTYRKPTLSQLRELERRVASGQPSAGSAPLRMLKDARSAVAQGLWTLALRHFIAPRITVLLYHRVSDDARDNLTVGIEQFERQMALLRRHCHVLSIDEVVRCETVPASDRPTVAVTFDDGYADNYLHAAPILMRHRIPAAFFVSTGIVGSDTGRFPHDIRRGNPMIPVMSWDQIRSLRDDGFTIGSHSVTHIDCAAEPEERVRSELAESRDRLAAELGIRDPIFGYPYGGRQHMTAQRLDLVRQAGYSACLSAYGGSNVAHVDRFNVLRRGIHWKFSDRAFLFECLGL